MKLGDFFSYFPLKPFGVGENISPSKAHPKTARNARVFLFAVLYLNFAFGKNRDDDDVIDLVWSASVYREGCFYNKK